MYAVFIKGELFISYLFTYEQIRLLILNLHVVQVHKDEGMVIGWGRPLCMADGFE